MERDSSRGEIGDEIPEIKELSSWDVRNIWRPCFHYARLMSGARSRVVPLVPLSQPGPRWFFTPAILEGSNSITYARGLSHSSRYLFFSLSLFPQKDTFCDC